MEPVYIRVAPRRDAWGNADRCVVADEGARALLSSAGADGTHEASPPAEEAVLESYEQDAVVLNGKFLRRWAYR